MEPRQLEAFAAVMSTGSVTGAARLLARSQPAVSRLVQELEAQVGYALFERHGPRVTPTEQGFLLYDDAERALAALRQLRQRAADVARGAAQPLLVAATSALAVGLLPEALRRTELVGGAGPVQLRSAAPEQVLHAVLSGSVQLGACSLPLEHRGLELCWIGELPCVAVLRHDDPLAAAPVLPVAALAGRRLVTMSNPYRLRSRLDAMIAEAGAAGPPPALIETNSSMNALALVRAGLGVAVLEPLTAHGVPLAELAVRRLDVDVPFYFGVITPQSRPLAKTARALADALLEVAAELPGFVRHDPADHASLLQAGAPPTRRAPKPATARRAR